jgi:hypothetical protein
MNIKNNIGTYTEMNAAVLGCPKDNLAEDRRVFGVLFTGAVLWYADVDTVLHAIRIVRGYTGITHLGVRNVGHRRIVPTNTPTSRSMIYSVTNKLLIAGRSSNVYSGDCRHCSCACTVPVMNLPIILNFAQWIIDG